jgi:DNA polymerase I
MDKRLYLLDAYALIYRAHYAFFNRPMLNAAGLNTSPIFGFTRALLDIMKKEKPTHLAVAFDLGRVTFRTELYPEYKAHRDETPDDIRKATPVIKDILRAMNIPILEVEGYEADDIIGTIAHRAQQHGYTTYMVTPDKDYGQLVTDHIRMYKPKKGDNDIEILGPTEICEHYGIAEPTQLIDILALWGDASDNIPGVPGIGEKTACKLVGEWGSVENLLANADKLKGKMKENIVTFQEQMMLSKKLATIVLDVPVDFDEEQLVMEEPNADKLVEIFTEMEFSSIMKEMGLSQPASAAASAPAKAAPQQAQMSLFGDTPMAAAGSSKAYNTIEDIAHTYHIAETNEQMEELVATLRSNGEFTFDTETTGLNPFDDRVVGMSFAIREHEAWYVPVTPDRQVEIMAIFRPLFEDEAIGKTGQNIKFDLQVLKANGIELRGKLFDTMIAHYLIEPELRHNMTYLAETYLHYSPVEIEELIGKKGIHQATMDRVALEQIAEYAAEDADVTLQLRNKLEPILKEQGLVELFETIEMPLMPVLADMEFTGVKIDDVALKEYAGVLMKDLLVLDEEIKAMAGVQELNINSPKQLGEILFDKLKISDTAKKTKTKQYSTSEETLQQLRDKHPIVDKILEFRGVKKLLSTYVEALPALISKTDGRIHTSYNQTVTATGRLSSNNPNLQNIPIRDERGKEIRRAFIASDNDHLVLSADYSQIELRLMAHFSNDPSMVEAFIHNADIHTATAAKVYHVEPSEVTREQRGRAKTANFGIIYGISAFGLSQRLNIPRGEAKELIDGYFESYPGVKAYMDNVIAQGRADGYVTTLFGRKRYLRNINAGNAMSRSLDERNAINAPLQGSAADIIKIAMIAIHAELKRRNLRTKMTLQVHDELVFDVYKPELDEVKQLVVELMEQAAQLSVPLTAEAGVGENWLVAH